jgi:hypothetical protein
MTRKQRAINERNKQYDNASPEEKCIIMAKHALLWMEMGALVPVTGNYLRTVEPDILRKLVDKHPGEQARDVVFGPCKACVKGALLLAKAELFDDVTVQALAEYAGDDLLEEEFGPEHIDDMERAFEQNVRYEGHQGPQQWARAYPDPKDRYRAILENVIRNKGIFKFDEVTPP